VLCMGKLKFFSTPYGILENLNWLIKHFIIDIFYPVVFLFLLFVIFTIIPLEVIVTIAIFLAVSVAAYAIRGIQRLFNRINNIGNLNEDGWREYTVNELQNIQYKIGFVGDIMKIGKYELRFEKRVIKFFKDANLMVGNLEGIITNKKWQGLSAQKHKISILRQLRRLGHPPQDWLLCASNNHSSDFGDKEFQKSNKIIRCKGYKVFGDMPHNQSFLFKNEINLVSGTMWNNQKENKCVAQFENIDYHYKEDKFNILYPHWHYENESYVRKRIQVKSIGLILMGYYLILEKIKRKLHQKIRKHKIYEDLSLFLKYRKIWRYLNFVDQLVNLKYYRNFNRKFDPNKIKDWDLIYGHHSHIPQPITNYGSKLLAFSGGNFTSSKTRKKHISGLIMKCQIGQLKGTEQLRIGKVEWSYIINEKEKIKEKRKGNTTNKRKIKVDSVIIDCKRNRNNCFTNLRNKIWITTIYIIFFSLFEFVLFCSIFNIFDIFSNYSIFIFSTAITFVILICIYLFKSHRS